MEKSLPKDVLLRIARDFSGADREHVIATGLSLNLPLSSPENDERVLRCILVASRGERKKFDEMVVVARRDWRNAIMAGEYGLSEKKKLARLRNLSAPFPTQEA